MGCTPSQPGTQRSRPDSPPYHPAAAPSSAPGQQVAAPSNDGQQVAAPSNDNQQVAAPSTDSDQQVAAPPSGSTNDKAATKFEPVEENVDTVSESDLWVEIDKIKLPEKEVKPDKARRGWKTIRLFVSSTFKDMHSEREYLVKHVFPQLRLWCEERKLRLIECDLRWGVPKGADTREVLMACLSEIDRCHEENTNPFFLNMLSERYGWVPKPDEVPQDIKTKYKWRPGMSVTSWEIFYGAYWGHNPNAIFFLRNPDFLEGIEDEKLLQGYVDTEETCKDCLYKLKGKLKDLFAGRTHEYRVALHEKVDNNLKLTGFEEMGQKVLEHFKQVIDHQYPSEMLGEELPLVQVQKLEHEIFMFQRSQVLLGRDQLVNDIKSYISSPSGVSTHPYVLVGFPGAGKSALMAYSAKLATSNTNYKVFYHFIGATPGSTALYQILSRLWQDLLPKQEVVPEDPDELRRSVEVILKRASETASSEGMERVVIFFDALNQMDDEGNTHDLVWLPRILPENVRLIVSTLAGRCLDSLRQGTIKLQELNVEPLGKDTRKEIAHMYLQDFNKVLDEEQAELLVSKEDAGRPLYLTVACEELRVFGEFRKVTQKIINMPGELIGLLQQVLERIVSEYGSELVTATLCLIETSRYGLLETELLELLAIHPVTPTYLGEDEYPDSDKLPMVKWALVYMGLKEFLRPCGSSGEGRLDFYHRTVSKVVRSMFFTQDSTAKDWWHHRLADYFKKCTDVERKAEELPYHLLQIGDKESLKACLLEKAMFNHLYDNEETRNQLLSYWRYLGGYELAANEYTAALEKQLEKMSEKNVDLTSPQQVKLSWFLIEIGQYDKAQDLLTGTLEDIERQYGNTSSKLMDPLFPMVHLFYRQALKVVYSSHPTYARCSKYGGQYSQACSKIHKMHCDPDDLHLGEVLTVCGYFQSDLLKDALAIFSKQDYKRGRAEVLYMMGEKNQYNNNMDIPLDYFKTSLELCKSQFGLKHLKTARCYQLYGQLYWNRASSFQVSKETHEEWMNTCLCLYQHELEIFVELLGPEHPLTVRSREDVIIILQTLGRHSEAAEYEAQQPASAADTV